MLLVYKDSKDELYEYSPSVHNLFGMNFEKHSFLTKIRFLIELVIWGGYKVYYLKQDGVYVASCIVSYGKNKRYFFAKTEDIIVGPYYVLPTYRGKGISEQILRLVLNYTSISYMSAWDYISNDNIPSIRASERVGFKKVMNIRISEISHRMKQNESGEYAVYRFLKGDRDYV